MKCFVIYLDFINKTDSRKRATQVLATFDTGKGSFQSYESLAV